MMITIVIIILRSSRGGEPYLQGSSYTPLLTRRSR